MLKSIVSGWEPELTPQNKREVARQIFKNSARNRELNLKGGRQERIPGLAEEGRSGVHQGA